MKKIVFAVIALVVVVATLGGVKAMQIMAMISAGEKFQLPPDTVSSVRVMEQVWDPTLEAVGTLSPVRGVTLSAEVAGLVKDIAFQSGAQVKKGDLLVQMDVDSEQAQLRSAEAQAELARLNADRAHKLRVSATISQSDMDNADMQLKQMVASVDQLKAVIAKKTISAPFDGSVGIRMVNEGQFVDVGKDIVSLQSMDKVYVDFTLPQQRLSLLQTGLVVRLTIDAYPDKKFEGKLTAINTEVDPMTRNVKLQGTLDNPGGLLRSGMYARVTIVLPNPEKVLAVPMTSVMYAPYGDSIYVVEPQKNQAAGATNLIARQQFVRLGRKVGDYISVREGLKVGEEVVTSGAFKLRNGSPVVINNAISPDAKLKPTPEDN